MIRCAAGVRPAAPGFERVHIAPQPGQLRLIESATPHPRGQVRVALRFDHETDACTGNVTLPADVTGELHWRDRVIALQGGDNMIEIQ